MQHSTHSRSCISPDTILTNFQHWHSCASGAGATSYRLFLCVCVCLYSIFLPNRHLKWVPLGEGEQSQGFPQCKTMFVPLAGSCFALPLQLENCLGLHSICKEAVSGCILTFINIDIFPNSLIFFKIFQEVLVLSTKESYLY